AGRWCQICTTVSSRLILRAEPGRGLPAGGVFGHERFQFPVQRSRFGLGQRLVQHVVVLLSEEMSESVGDARADPDVDGLPAELLDRRQSARTTDEYTIWGDGDRLQETGTVDGGGQFIDVTQLGTVPPANHDRGNRALQLDVPRWRAHDWPPPRSPQPPGAARETVRMRSSSRSSTGSVSPISSRSSTPRPAAVAA